MSPRSKKRAEVVASPKVEITLRDYTMARLAAARAAFAAGIDAIDDAIGLFVDPDDDDDGSERKEMIETALEHAGAAARALECAEEVIDHIDPEECEPWDADEEES